MSNQKIDMSNYYLDLDKVSKLSTEVADRIHGYYIDLIHEANGSKMRRSIFNTLSQGGYLLNINVEVRDEKIENILKP